MEPAEALTQVAISEIVDRLMVPINRGRLRGSDEREEENGWGWYGCVSDIKDQNLDYFKNAKRGHVFKIKNTSPIDDFEKPNFG